MTSNRPTIVSEIPFVTESPILRGLITLKYATLTGSLTLSPPSLSLPSDGIERFPRHVVGIMLVSVS